MEESICETEVLNTDLGDSDTKQWKDQLQNSYGCASGGVQDGQNVNGSYPGGFQFVACDTESKGVQQPNSVLIKAEPYDYDHDGDPLDNFGVTCSDVENDDLHKFSKGNESEQPISSCASIYVKEEVSIEDVDDKQLKTEEDGVDGINGDIHTTSVADERVYNSEECKLESGLNFREVDDGRQCKSCGNISPCQCRLQEQSVKNVESTLKQFECDICNKKLRTRQTLVRHKLVHDNAKQYECNICHKYFKRADNLKSHRLTHSTFHAYQCDVCKKGFYQLQTLKRHKPVHERTTENYESGVYNTCLSQDKFLQEHICTDLEVKEDNCDTFADARSAQKHRSVQYISSVNYCCVVCNKTFVNLNELKIHRLSHIPKEQYKCDTCNEESPQLDDLTQHNGAVHNDYRCDIVNETSVEMCVLNEEKLIRSGVKKYQCDVCKRDFPQPSTLSEHKLIHTDKREFAAANVLSEQKLTDSGIKKHECEMCNKRFTQAITLSYHKLIHSGVKHFQCDICNKAFAHPSALRNHKLIHSGVKRYQCDVCKKMFAQPSALWDHKLIHSGIKKYKCDVCDKAFKWKGSLTQHKLLIHSFVKQFQCGICNQAFAQPAMLRKHKTIHSSVKKH